MIPLNNPVEPSGPDPDPAPTPPPDSSLPDIPGSKVKDVHVRKVTIDVWMDDACQCLNRTINLALAAAAVHCLNKV
jgi:hypothetical protein